MPTIHVDLTDHLNRFITSGINSGRFSDASEVVREGLQLLERRDAEDAAKLEWLRAAYQEGMDSIDRGEGIVFESMEDLSTFIEQTGEELIAEHQRA